MEGVLADIAPQINMIEIASRHISESMWKDLDWKKELKHAGKNLYRSMHKAVEVPGLAADALHGLMKGQTRVNLDLHASNDLAQLLRRLVRNVVMGLWVMALLISSIRSNVENIRGTQMFITFFTLVPSFSFFDKSSPLLCCASAISC